VLVVMHRSRIRSVGLRAILATEGLNATWIGTSPCPHHHPAEDLHVGGVYAQIRRRDFVWVICYRLGASCSGLVGASRSGAVGGIPDDRTSAAGEPAAGRTEPRPTGNRLSPKTPRDAGSEGSRRPRVARVSARGNLESGKQLVRDESVSDRTCSPSRSGPLPASPARRSSLVDSGCNCCPNSWPRGGDASCLRK